MAKDGKRLARHICIIAERARHVKGSYNRKYDDYMLGLPLSAQYKSSTIS